MDEIAAPAVARIVVGVDRSAAAASALRWAFDDTLVLSGKPPQLIDEWQLDATRVWNHVRAEVD